MLLIRRTKGQKIIMDGGIELCIVAVVPSNSGGHVVTVGIKAPEDVVVHRKEVNDALSKGETGGTLDGKRPCTGVKR